MALDTSCLIPVSVLDSSTFYKEDYPSSPSPILKRSIDFQDILIILGFTFRFCIGQESSVYPFTGSTRISCSCNIPTMYHKVRLRHREVRRQSSSTASFYIEEKEPDISKATLIWRAIKLPIYSVALVPLTVASAAAYFQTGFFSVRRFFVLLGSTVLIILWLNLRLLPGRMCSDCGFRASLMAGPTACLKCSTLR